jgi:hypothetical protein
VFLSNFSQKFVIKPFLKKFCVFDQTFFEKVCEQAFFEKVCEQAFFEKVCVKSP